MTIRPDLFMWFLTYAGRADVVVDNDMVNETSGRDQMNENGKSSYD